MPVFYQPWYLDAVCTNGTWDVALSFNDGEINGVWPYYRKKKLGLTYLTLPYLTPYLGPLVKRPKNLMKPPSVLGYEKKVLKTLARKLPSALFHVCQGYPDWTNWLPLKWENFNQTTRYTYRLNLEQSLSEIKAGFTDKTRNRITTVEDKVEIRESSSTMEIYKLIQDSFDRQNLIVPYSFDFFENLNGALNRERACKCFVAVYNNIPVAMAYVIFDHSCTYLLATGRSNNDPGGSVALLIWKCIQEAKKINKTVFDFEGSVIQNIESFFRSFGGTQTPYHRVDRTSNKMTYLILKTLNRI